MKLRYALYPKDHDGIFAKLLNQGDDFNHFIDNPNSTIQIVATSDSVCERCNEEQDCTGRGVKYGRALSLYDRIMAKASGTRVGKEYQSSELQNLLEQQSIWKREILEISAVFIYWMIYTPYKFLDWIKPQREEPSTGSR